MHDSGAVFFRTLLGAQPHLAQVRADLAQCLMLDGDYAGAIAESTTALQQDETLVLSWLVRAQAHKARCQFESAIIDFEHAARLAPNRASILTNLAHCYAELDLLGEAETRLRQAVALDPGSLEAQASYGSILLRHGKPELAEDACRAALALNPDHIGAHRNLSGLLAERDPEQAKAHRDAAYRQQQIFIERAASPRRRVLVLSAADAANVPLRFLMPRTHNTRIHWYGEYATPDQDRRLPEFDLIFNAVGDADLAPPLSPPVARLLHEHRALVLNRPEQVAATRRSDLPGLLAGIDDVAVPAVRFGAAPGMALPLLARPAGSHGGEGVKKITSTAELDALETGHCYFTQFVDYRSPDGWYRKYRFIFVGGRTFAYHLAISSHWLVHYWTSGMAENAGKRAEEQKFLQHPRAMIGEKSFAALEKIAARLGLDYGGIDFGILPDGRLLVFEANATMLVHPEHDALFAYRNPAVAAIGAAFEAMLALPRVMPAI